MDNKQSKTKLVSSVNSEIIHCKDCLYWIPPVDKEPYILPSCTFTYGYWDEDDFCSYAVKREEVQE